MVAKGLRHPSIIRRVIQRKMQGKLVTPYLFRRALGIVLPPYGRRRFRSVYVVTYGRSGSTLLTGYLSMLPGFDIRGENYLYALPLARTDERIKQLSNLKYGQRHKTSSPWYGSHLTSYARFRRQMRRMFLDQMYPLGPIPKTLGFKEIRWWYQLDEERFESDLDWLVSLFAPGAIVVLTRDLERVFGGAWWAEMSEIEKSEVAPKIEAFEKRALDYVKNNPERAFHVTYEGFTSDENVAHQLTEFLGVKFSQKRWAKALNTSFSYPSERKDETNSR